MNEKEFSLQEEDKEKIKSAVKFHNPMEITSYTLPKNMEVYIQEVLGEFLMECHQEHMIDYLKFCVDELLNNSKKAKRVLIRIARNAKGKKVAITKVNANVLNNKKGKKVTYVNLKPYKGAKITVKAKAFNKSKVKTVVMTLGSKGKVQLNKNAFKGTKAKTVKFTIKAKKTSQVTFKKGAFAGLSKKSVIKVKKTMSKKQYKKLVKAAKKAGFKGTIKRA